MTSKSPEEPSGRAKGKPDKLVSLQATTEIVDLARRSKPREAAKERDARLAEEGKQNDHERGKEILVLRAVIGLVGATALVAFIVVLFPSFPDDVRKWGAVSLTSILSMAVGYLGGKASK
jgi:hypothetical protein